MIYLYIGHVNTPTHKRHRCVWHIKIEIACIVLQVVAIDTSYTIWVHETKVQWLLQCESTENWNKTKFKVFFLSLFGLCPTRNFVLLNIFTVFICPANNSIHSGRSHWTLFCVEFQFVFQWVLNWRNTFRCCRFNSSQYIPKASWRPDTTYYTITALILQNVRWRKINTRYRRMERKSNNNTRTHGRSRRLGHAHTMFDHTHVPFSFC